MKARFHPLLESLGKRLVRSEVRKNRHKISRVGSKEETYGGDDCVGEMRGRVRLRRRVSQDCRDLWQR